jgi:hypothetical protein
MMLRILISNTALDLERRERHRADDAIDHQATIGLE